MFWSDTVCWATGWGCYYLSTVASLANWKANNWHKFQTISLPSPFPQHLGHVGHKLLSEWLAYGYISWIALRYIALDPSENVSKVQWDIKAGEGNAHTSCWLAGQQSWQLYPGQRVWKGDLESLWYVIDSAIQSCHILQGNWSHGLEISCNYGRIPGPTWRLASLLVTSLSS